MRAVYIRGHGGPEVVQVGERPLPEPGPGEVRVRVVAAALNLAYKKDPAAFEALTQLLREAQDSKAQRDIIAALVTLGDPRAPAALLDRLEDDPAGTALGDNLIRAAGDFRREEEAERILALMDRDRRWRNATFQAVLDARQKLIQGYSLHQALTESGLFPGLMTKMVKVGEDSGSLPEMLGDVTEYYEDEVSATVGAITSMIEPALIVSLGAVVLVVILGIYLPIFGLSRAAAKGAAK